MQELLRRFINEEEGQDLVEYALLLFLIAIVVIAAIPPLATAAAGVYTTITASL